MYKASEEKLKARSSLLSTLCCSPWKGSHERGQQSNREEASFGTCCTAFVLAFHEAPCYGTQICVVALIASKGQQLKDEVYILSALKEFTVEWKFGLVNHTV